MRRSIAVNNDAMKEATVSRYRDLPPLPTERELAGWLRELNANLDGECHVWLYCQGAGWPDAEWKADNGNELTGDPWPGSRHAELVPGDGKRFDATAAARRLLSEARQAGFK